MNTNHNFALQRIQKEFEIQKKKKPFNKYIVIYRAIKNCIHKIELPDDWLLPSTRVLSETLDLSRTTVIKAYELLLLEKLIVSKTGSGYRVQFEVNKVVQNEKIVHKSNAKDLYQNISSKGQSYVNNIGLINRLPNNNLAFRPGLPPIDVFPVNQWKKLLNGYWRHVKSSGLSYSQSTGLNELKKSVANYLNVSRNIKCNSNQIIIVSGSLQSLYLIANTLIDPGDSVVLENPLFPNVHSVFKSSQADLIPVALDQEGISLDGLQAITDKNPKLIHVTPSNQYPLGTKMSLNRRLAILNWAASKKAFVIENDYENEIANHTVQIPTIFSLDTEDRTIYIGTFNRLLHPSIRLGYMVVPAYLTEVIEALQEHSHRFVSPSIQTVMNQFIEKNYLYQHIKNCIEAAQERHAMFVSEFQSNCQSMYLQPKPISSFHLLAFFKDSTSELHEKEIIRKLNEQNISTFSLSKCYIGKPEKQGLILGYSSVRPAVIKKEVKKMGLVL
jgi:GntR family transcriptional regulator/MocR family aminotransferase